MIDYQYHDLLRTILISGIDKSDRTGTGTRSLFGAQLRFFMGDDEFPLITTKRIYTRAIIHELLWFLRGETNVAYLRDNKVTIWDEWADEAGELGPIYGKQWRSWNAPDGRKIDQLTEIIGELRSNPDSRRLVVSAWNPAELDAMALAPCHCLFQFYVSEGRLSLHMYQRSADVFLGVPFNIASYAMLLAMVAQTCGLARGNLVISFGDVHIYRNHFDQVHEQLKRLPTRSPRLVLNREIRSLFDFKFEDIMIKGYDPHSAIKAPVAV